MRWTRLELAGFLAEPGPAPIPTASPTAINPTPIHTAAPGIVDVIGTPIAAAAIGATPVSNPARPAPNACTHEYHRMKATAVTPTARYAMAIRSPTSKLVAAD